MSHYPQHVSGLDMPIFRRNNCRNTASGILALLGGCTLHRLRADSINAEQAKPVHQYKDTKIKLYKNNAAIWYNKTCRTRQITPTYANIKMKGANSRCQRTKDAAIRFRINQDKSALNRCSVQPPSTARIPDAVFVQLFLLKMGMSRPETCRG